MCLSVLLVQFAGVAALGVRAGDVAALGAGAFHHEDGGIALRAGFGHGPVPHGKVTAGVLVAGIEYLAALGAFLHQNARGALGAGHLGGIGRGVVALGVVGTA